MKKLGIRTMPIISRNSDDLENSPVYPNWMNDFAKKSVQPYRKDEESVFDQISSIINSSKPKYSSVEDAVKDMQERSGLLAYQKQMRSFAEAIKIAGCTCEHEEKNEKPKIKIFEIKPQVQSTIDNFIEDTHGNLPIPSIIERAKSIHKNDITDDSSWDDDGLLSYINDKSIDVKKQNPTNDDQYTTLGKLPQIDDKDIEINQDVFKSLSPTSFK